MVRKAEELSPLEVKRLKGPGRHAVGGVAGLYLYLNEGAGSSWVLRVTAAGKRQYMGLGPYPEVGLGEARDKAREAKALFAQGINPKDQRRELASALKAKQALLKTFEEAVLAYIETHGDGWKNPKHRAQWISTLKTYAFPKIGSLLVKDVGQEAVLSVLEPIWKEKTETASRLRGRIEAVLDWSKVRGYRSGENPAAWKGHLDQLLVAPGKIAKVEHHRSLEYAKLPDFMSRLRLQPGVSAHALEFLILCAARSGEVRGATWSEVDFQEGVWTIPAERMKVGKEHRVPLSKAAMALLKAQPRIADSEHIFPGRKGGALSDMSLSKVMRDMKVDAVPHGFRSTFRDWLGDETAYPRELAEQALAHTLPNKVEAAYRRKDALEKRRKMMEDWADFCANRDKEMFRNVFNSEALAASRKSWKSK